LHATEGVGRPASVQIVNERFGIWCGGFPSSRVKRFLKLFQPGPFDCRYIAHVVCFQAHVHCRAGTNKSVPIFFQINLPPFFGRLFLLCV
jgi:hypothetical protein